MIRGLIYVLLLSTAVVLAVWLADRPGQVVLAWEGLEVRTSVPILLLTLGVFLGALFFTAQMLYRFWTMPERLAEMRAAIRQERLDRALAEGTRALALGDRQSAAKAAGRVRKLGGRTEVVALLSGQAPREGGGDVLSLRQSMDGAVRVGQVDLVAGLAPQVADLGQDLGTEAGLWMAETAVGALLRLHRHQEAGDVVRAVQNQGKAHRDVAQRLMGGVLGMQTRAMIEAGDGKGALGLAREAQDAWGDDWHGVLIHAEALLAAGQADKAVKLVAARWDLGDGMALAPVALALLATEEPLRRGRLAERITGPRNDALSRLVRAEAAVEGGLWGAARRELDAIALDVRDGNVLPRFQRKALSLRARVVEQDESNPTAANALLHRALALPQDEDWSCRRCGAIWPEHDFICGRCFGVGRLTPQTAAQGALPAPAV